MRAIFHAGMHKTGSSSIQQTLFEMDVPGLYYPKWGNGNHSGLVVLLFEEDLEKHHGFRAQGQSREELEARKAEWQTQLRDALAEGRHERVLISAERIVAADRAAVERMKAFFAPYCDDFRVIAYVRPPVGYMTSAFQQRLKGNLKRIELQWPAYRAAFGKLDAVFGRENVTLKPFRPAALKDGDVVADFGMEVGIDIPPDRIRRVNEGLSLEAAALLFAQRRLGEGFVQGFRGALKKNQDFIDALVGIGTGKLAFAPELVEPVIEANRADLDWIEARLGEPLGDVPATGGRQIASEADFLEIAEENRSALEEVLIARLRAPDLPPRARMLRNLELLRQFHDRGRRPARPQREKA